MKKTKTKRRNKLKNIIRGKTNKKKTNRKKTSKRKTNKKKTNKRNKKILSGGSDSQGVGFGLLTKLLKSFGWPGIRLYRESIIDIVTPKMRCKINFIGRQMSAKYKGKYYGIVSYKEDKTTFKVEWAAGTRPYDEIQGLYLDPAHPKMYDEEKSVIITVDLDDLKHDIVEQVVSVNSILTQPCSLKTHGFEFLSLKNVPSWLFESLQSVDPLGEEKRGLLMSPIEDDNRRDEDPYKSLMSIITKNREKYTASRPSLIMVDLWAVVNPSFRETLGNQYNGYQHLNKDSEYSMSIIALKAKSNEIVAKKYFQQSVNTKVSNPIDASLESKFLDCYFQRHNFTDESGNVCEFLFLPSNGNTANTVNYRRSDGRLRLGSAPFGDMHIDNYGEIFYNQPNRAFIDEVLKKYVFLGDDIDSLLKYENDEDTGRLLFSGDFNNNTKSVNLWLHIGEEPANTNILVFMDKKNLDKNDIHLPPGQGPRLEYKEYYSGEELRIDPVDGKAYNYASFLEAYDSFADQHWSDAGRSDDLDIYYGENCLGPFEGNIFISSDCAHSSSTAEELIDISIEMGTRESLETRVIIVPVNSHAKEFVRIKIDNLDDPSHMEAIKMTADWRNEVKRKAEERIAVEKAERIAVEKAKRERIAVEKAEIERIALEKAERERIAVEEKKRQCPSCGGDTEPLNHHGMCSMACYQASFWG